MTPKHTTSFAASLVLAALASGANAATLVNINSYSYLTAPSNGYLDSGGELTDGVTTVVTWPAVNFVPDPYGEVAKLVGWQYTDPAIRFDFAPMTTISSVTVWAADSDGYAGVALPTWINVRNLSGSFSQNFSITDPAGLSSTVPLELSGFSVTADALIVSATRDPLHNNWTMFSEVQFVSAIPEPATPPFLVGLAGLALLHRRRI